MGGHSRPQGATRVALGAVALLASCSARGVPERCYATVPQAMLSGPVTPGPPLGAGMGIQLQSWYLQPGDLDRIAAAGFGVVRWGIPWDAIETAPGVYDWREADRFVDALARSRLRSIIILGFGNHLYAGPGGTPAAKTEDARVESRPPTEPAARAAFARFAAAAAARYRGRSITWEIWNEPDSATFWKPAPDPEAYARLASQTCTAIRAVAPQATVLGGAGAAMPNAVAGGDNLYRAMARAGSYACLDGVSAHAYRMSGFYREPDPESIERDNEASLAYLRTTLRLPPGKRLVTTEWGYPTAVVGAERQAAYLVRANLMNAATGVPLTVWYEWRDSRDDHDDPESHFGLLPTKGAPKDGRGLAILSAIAQARLVGRVGTSCDAARLLLLDRGGARFLIGWLRSDDAPDRSTLVVNGVSRGALSLMPSIIWLKGGSSAAPAARGRRS